MNKLYFALLCCLSLPIFAQDDKKGNIFTDVKDEAKMIVAKQKYYAGSYLSALSTYRDVESHNPGDATVKYYVGLCYYSLGDDAKAKETLNKALDINKNVKPETWYLLGRIYHKEENIEKATEYYQKFNASPDGDKIWKEDVQTYLLQCEVAKTMMGSPLDVTVQNLGPGLNSKYDDKNPCVTADGRSLVFTTRRPETTSDQPDMEGDGKYFENIYMATADSATRAFTQAHALDKHVNTPAHDAVTSISPDGKQLFIYKNDINDKESRGGNVFVSKLLNGKWKTPESLGKPVNTTYWEGGVCVSTDGKRYFFTSEREGGFGGSDIWMVERKSKKIWGEPINLGPTVNSKFDEAGMFLAPDGKTLFFCSNGPKSIGNYDVFRTIFEGGKWSEPANLGYPINSTAKEGQLTVSADARYAYVSSDRKGGNGESDVYMIDLKDYAILEKDGKKNSGNGLSILRGTIREGFEGFGIQDVEISITDDKSTLIASTSTNENGEYFVTMHSGKYTINVRKKGFKDITDSVEIAPAGKETAIIEKGYLLKK